MPKDPAAGDDFLNLDPSEFIDANNQESSRIGRFNLAIVGPTGVGKSSLVNAVFGEDRAATGVGLPVTRGVQYYTDKSLGIWDFDASRSAPRSRPQHSCGGTSRRSPPAPESSTSRSSGTASPRVQHD